MGRGEKRSGRAAKPLWRRLIGIGLIGALLSIGFVWATNQAVLSDTEERIFTSPRSIPFQRVALVLGTSPRTNGVPNPFFERRMDAAALLYREGRVRKILVSGDNGLPTYNEPTAMKKALVGRGVPEQDVVCDFAGFHTLDSIVRARKVFGVEACTIVTDDFHLPRALHIADAEGVQAVGFSSVPLPRSIAPQTYWREIGARTQTWIDLHVLNKQPKFLGPKKTV